LVLYVDSDQLVGRD